MLTTHRHRLSRRARVGVAPPRVLTSLWLYGDNGSSPVFIERSKALELAPGLGPDGCRRTGVGLLLVAGTHGDRSSVCTITIESFNGRRCHECLNEHWIYFFRGAARRGSCARPMADCPAQGNGLRSPREGLT